MMKSLKNAVIADRYKVIRILGEGGMGRVLQVEDTQLNRSLALKMLKSDHDDSAKKRVIREAKLGAKLNHPNIVQVFDVFEYDSVPCIAMELIEGTDLQDLLFQGLTFEKAKPLLAQVAEAVAVAHDQGIVHRDLKPENIFVINETAKVGDWGLSRSSLDTSGITKTGVLLGTPGYMAPEAILFQKTSPACDIYSLGCILWEIVHGAPLFDGDTPLALVKKHLDKKRPNPQTASSQIGKLLMQMVSYDAKNRPTAREVADVLSGKGHASGRAKLRDRNRSRNKDSTLEVQAVRSRKMSQEFGQLPEGQRSYKALFAIILLLSVVIGYSLFSRRPIQKVENNPIKALEEAAKKGDKQAAYRLGNHYMTAKRPDFKLAMKYLTMAHEGGMEKATLTMASMLVKGKEVPRDKERAVELYMEAAQRGSAEAAFSLGQIYYSEDKNNEKASHWFNKAAKSEHGKALGMLGRICQEGEDCVKNRKLAFYYFHRGAKVKDPYSMTRLGLLYEGGRVVPINEKLAFDLHHQSAQAGCGEGMYNLGKAYEVGRGTAVDKEKAFQLYKRAYEECGHGTAYLKMGSCYERGIGTKKDIQRATEIYKECTEKFDHPIAWYCLGAKYDAKGTKEDLALAVKCYERAFEKGHELSLKCLADCLERLGTPEAKERAAKLKRKFESDVIVDLMDRKSFFPTNFGK